MRRLRLIAFCVVLVSWATDRPPVRAQEKAESAPQQKQNLQQEMLGAWALAGKPDTKDVPGPGARMKFWGLKHWVITESDPDTQDLIYHHGGTYTLDGDNYVEKITFAAPNTKQLIGLTLKFKIKVEGETYTQFGDGNSFSEKWVRLKPE